MMLNKKGAALMQVLLVTAILAGMATMLLRAKLGRTGASRKVRRSIAAQMLIKSCQAEVNTIWSMKTPEEFAWAMDKCAMRCLSNLTPNDSGELECPGMGSIVRSHRCHPHDLNELSGQAKRYQVEAVFTGSTGDAASGLCELKYNLYECGDQGCSRSNYEFPENL